MPVQLTEALLRAMKAEVMCQARHGVRTQNGSGSVQIWLGQHAGVFYPDLTMLERTIVAEAKAAVLAGQDQYASCFARARMFAVNEVTGKIDLSFTGVEETSHKERKFYTLNANAMLAQGLNTLYRCVTLLACL